MHKRRGKGALTLIELLCVMVIVSILASLLLPTILRVYHRIKGTAEEIEAEEVADMLVHSTRSYCARNAPYRFDSKSDFADKCGLPSKCRDWVQASTTDFAPFSYLDPTNKLVLWVHIGRNHATLYAFNKGQLTITPDER